MSLTSSYSPITSANFGTCLDSAITKTTAVTMPVRGKSRVTKPNALRRASRHLPTPTTPRDHLHQLRPTNANPSSLSASFPGASTAATQHHQFSSEAYLPKTESGLSGHSIGDLPSSSFDSDVDAEGDDDFELHAPLSTNPNTPGNSFHSLSGLPSGIGQPLRTAAAVAQMMYSGQVKIDSALCKKLGQDPALREPTQRRDEQKLNLGRRSNVEALLAHITGQPPAKSCKNCHKGHGPWTECIVYEGQMCGSCTNCWYNASGSRCTFHENNHPQSQTLYTPPPTANPIMGYPPPLPSAHSGLTLSSQNVSMLAMAHQMTTSEMNNASWNLEDPTGRLIGHAMVDALALSRRDRYVARIESAAEELGMRLAEYDEFLRTPEGASEQEAHEERERRHGIQDHGHDQGQMQVTEAHLDTASSHDSSLV